MCTKKRIDAEYKAKQIVQIMQEKHRELYQYYYCKECETFHVAHLINRAKMEHLRTKIQYQPKGFSK